MKRAAILVFLLLLGTSVPAAESTEIVNKHLGVASCANGICHGSVSARAESTVAQNEYVIWSTRDKHAKSYQVLGNALSKSIAKKLGIGNPQNEKICLDCHTDNTPNKYQGPKFQHDDGIACESCHGGAERWIVEHSLPKTHAENVQAGMTDLSNPVTRAQRCLDCHYGNNQQFATHAIMGAGHPRLSFEVDTFMVLQPYHYKFDEDYQQRKGITAPINNWLIGQLVNADRLLETLRGPRFQQGLLPELALFDCHACHHAMNEQRYAERAETKGIGPGKLRINDGALVMLRALVRALAPENENKILTLIQNLHQASQTDRSAVMQPAQELQQIVRQVVTQWRAQHFAEQDMAQLEHAILAIATNGDFADYIAAEQAVMGLELLCHERGPDYYQQHKNSLDSLYRIAKDENHFSSAQFSEALATWLPKSSEK